MKSKKDVMRNSVLASIFAFGFSSFLSAADVYWTGAGADNSWATSGNWSGGAPANNTVRFDTLATSQFIQNLNVVYTVAGVVVGSPGGDIVLTNKSLTINAGGIDMSGATRNLKLLPTVNASQTWTVKEGQTLTAYGNFVADWGRTLTLNGAGRVVMSNCSLQAGSSGGTGTINHTSGTLEYIPSANGPFFIGHSNTLGTPGVGIYNLSGGTMILPSGDIRLGNQSASGDGRFNLFAGTIAATNANLHVGFVAGGKGAYAQTNGTAVFSLVNVPNGTGATGTVTQSGGTLATTRLNVGTVGAGTMTLTNTGVLNLSGTATVGSGTAGTVGALNLDGGTVNFLTTSANLANGANGTITANGVKFSNQTGTSVGVSTGTVFISASMVLGAGGLTVLPSAGASRWVQLNGNLSGAGGMTFDSQAGNTFVLAGANNTFLGGITVASGYFGNTSAGAVPVGSAVSLTGNWGLGASATIGSLTGNGIIFRGSSTVYTLTVGANDASSIFSGSLGTGQSITFALNKIGTGTLTLKGICTYVGGTIVSNGTLDVGGRIAPTNTTGVTVTSLGCLAGTGRVDRVVMQDGGRLMPGTAAACGTLTVSNLTLSANSVVVINAGTATNSTLNVTGTGTALSGTVRVESIGGKNIRKILGLSIPGGYTGTFSKVESSSGNFSYVAVYGDKTVTLVPMIGTMIRVL